MWAGYLATVTFMDEQVGRILKALKELGLDQETAIFFTSDHGYLLGEHHFWQKGNLREEVTRVPLIIKAPGFKPGQTKSIVELVDLFPTACSMLNLNTPSSVQGSSILPILKNPKEQSTKPALSFVPNRKGTSMRTPKWSYMKYKDGSEELYDMTRDPLQFSNLAGSSNHHEDLSKLRHRFRSQMKRIQ